MNHPTPSAKRSLATALTLVTAGALSTCSSLPQSNAQLDQARRDHRAVSSDPRAQGHAGDELQRATDALRRADAAWSERASKAEVNHLAYLASQRAAIVRTTLDTRTAQDTADAAVAQRRARDEAMDRNRRLGERLLDLNARQTPRGLVIIMGDGLFDADRAALRPDGQRLVQQLASVLNEFPQRNALIEGHTDGTGSDAYNQTLSSQRADAVRSALLRMGIASFRITALGYGESAPVSGNDTAAGREMNRRVEIVLSDDNGQLSTR